MARETDVGIVCLLVKLQENMHGTIYQLFSEGICETI